MDANNIQAEQNGCRQRLEGYLSCQQRLAPPSLISTLSQENMSELYDNARKLLMEEGWTQLAPSRFSKGNREIVFDTSTWVEVYEKDRGRIAEFKLQEFHNKIRELI